MSLDTPLSGLTTERSAIPPVQIWRLSVEQYHEMIRTGILGEDDPVELLDGYLVPKMPKNPPHRVATGLVREALERMLPEGWYVDSQEPVTLATSEPEPDVAVVRGQRRDYADHHPGPGDVALVVEVADASLQRDQQFKGELYAQAGIATYWIVNLLENRLEVYRDPSGPTEKPTYRQRQTYAADGEVPVVLEGRQIGQLAVRRLFP